MNATLTGRATATAQLACALTTLLAAAPAFAQTTAAPAIVRVVHGIPGRDVAATLDPQLPVDVLVNNKLCVLQNFTFGTVSAPFSLPAGSYNIKVSLSNSVAPCSNAPVLDKTVPVTSGEEAAVVAALSPEGKPRLDAFALDFSTVAAGMARVIVAHAADAPAVAVAVNRRRAIKGLAPEHEAEAVLPAGTYTVTVFPAGKDTPVIGPLPLTLPDRAAVAAFAVGSATSGSITAITATIPSVF